VKIAGYRLSGPWGRGYFFAPEALKRVSCAACEHVLCVYLPGNVVLKAYFDYANTYDCRPVVSERFRRYCVRLRLPGVRFVEVNRRRKLHWLVADRVVPHSRDRRDVRFGRACRRCKYHPNFLVEAPTLDRRHSTLRRGFWRTDIMFGDMMIAHPIVMVDIDTARRLRRRKFTGLKLIPVTARAPGDAARSKPRPRSARHR
jgi:hypothetical protein